MTTFNLALNEDHDLFLDGSNLALASEDDIVRQRLSTALQFIYDEWFLDNSVGVPYVQVVFAQGTNIDDLYSLFSRKISSVDGVDSITSLELTPSTDEKSLSIDYSVNQGTVTGSVEVP